MRLTNRIKEDFDQVLESSRKRLRFENFGYLPRWIIFSIDIFICVISLIITSFIVRKLSGFDLGAYLVHRTELAIVVVNIFFFIILRTYAGLIRHSSFIDAVKFFLASAGTFFSLIIVDYIFYLVHDENVFEFSKLVIYFSISFTILFLMRVFVKQIYENFIKSSNSDSVIKVLIYGVDENAIAIANAIKSEYPSRFKPVGFVNNDEKNESKEILGLPIIHFKKKISVLLRVNKAKALILADNNITSKERLQLVDDCLDYNFKIYQAPLVSDLKNDKNVSKSIEKIKIEDLLERDPIVMDNKLIVKDLFAKTVFVTGGAGSIGSEIVRQVANYKIKKLIIIDQAETPLYHIQTEINNNFPNLDFEAVVADVSNYEKIESVFKEFKPDIVYHAAAYKHVPLMENNPSEAIFVNVQGTRNLADLSLKYDTNKFVMVSTDKAVNPSNVMGASKRIAEMYVQSLHYYAKESSNLKTNFITTRFGNVLGSNGSVVPLFKEQIAKGGPLTITHPDIIRYFMTIPEACQLVLEAAAMGNGGEIFIFDMGKAVKIIDLAKKIIKLSGFTPYKDIDIKVIGLRPGEKLYEELLNDQSTTLPTYHDKIMIAKLDPGNYKRISEEISVLIDYANLFDTHKIVSQMKVIVPEFKSMNSSFSLLDHNN
jgi:FlaA1/EpsC-like NDP-sugar epimerase